VASAATVVTVTAAAIMGACAAGMVAWCVAAARSAVAVVPEDGVNPNLANPNVLTSARVGTNYAYLVSNSDPRILRGSG
jgi:dienelactone hydrolase